MILARRKASPSDIVAPKHARSFRIRLTMRNDGNCRS
jgi:hypothetical protein